MRVDQFEWAAVIEPIHPFEGGVFNGLERAPRSTLMDYLGLEQTDDRLGEGFMVIIPDAADRLFDAHLGEALGVANAHVLLHAVGMTDEAAASEGRASSARVLVRVPPSGPNRACRRWSRSITTTVRPRTSGLSFGEPTG